MLRIGIINDMSPAASSGIERYFGDLLNQAAGDGMSLTVRWFRLLGAHPVSYDDFLDLRKHRLDGLIITGGEPKAAILQDEPIWQPLIKTIDWAAHATSSVIFSGMATHAAALYLDGVEYHPRAYKMFGLYPAIKTATHQLLMGTPDTWWAPHSRSNDLLRDELEVNGYQVLVASPGAGIDTFAKQVWRSHFIFLQSHTELDPGVLLREYRRDVERFYLGSRIHFPVAPANYFDERTTTQLEALRHHPPASNKTRGQRILELATLPAYNWKSTAVQMYRNWLSMLQAAQAKHLSLLPAE